MRKDKENLQEEVEAVTEDFEALNRLRKRLEMEIEEIYSDLNQQETQYQATEEGRSLFSEFY
jgi:peptidoglycan hydrolase CwlO-like protein